MKKYSTFYDCIKNVYCIFLCKMKHICRGTEMLYDSNLYAKYLHYRVRSRTDSKLRSPPEGAESRRDPCCIETRYINF